MAENIVLLAVRQEPDILRRIVNDPDNHLDQHAISMIERMAFDNILRQAFGRRRYASANDNRHRTYRNYLDKFERYALQKEVEYMERRHLTGVDLFEEIAMLMCFRFKSRFTWRDVKAIIEVASEVIADLELEPNKTRSKVA